jgi:histidinol-phosphate aminotransferase
MSYFRPNIDAMEGYKPGEQPREQGFVKLNTNENPYPPSPRVIEAIQRELTDRLRRYPDPVAQRVREKAAAAYGLTPDHILVGNGSDDLLTMVCRAFVGEGDMIVQPSPTYTLYETLAQIQGARVRSIPYQTLTRLPDGMVQPGARVTFVANPNSPTGTVVPVEELDELAGRIDGVLVIDEAYVDFADRNSLELVPKHDNVLVLRSFSKSFSLAALRIGLGMGHPTLIEGLMKVKDSYNVNRLSQVAAAAALDDIGYMHEMARRVRQTREELTKTLRGLGFEVYASQANFLWVKCIRPPARLLYEELKRRKVLIRYFRHPGLDDCLRITIGSPEDVQVLVTEIKSIMKEETAKGGGTARS